MAEPSQKIARFLMVFIALVLIFKSMSGTGLFVAKSHRGKGYSVDIPVGWSKAKKRKNAIYPQGVRIVEFVPEGTDLEVKEPNAIISIFTKKLDAPIWIEDEFPNILKSLWEAGYEIKDKGEIKVGGSVMSWVVYYDQRTPRLNLEFYAVSDTAMFYKIQYSAHPDEFSISRPAFEQLRESFEFKFTL